MYRMHSKTKLVEENKQVGVSGCVLSSASTIIFSNSQDIGTKIPNLALKFLSYITRLYVKLLKQRDICNKQVFIVNTYNHVASLVLDIMNTLNSQKIDSPSNNYDLMEMEFSISHSDGLLLLIQYGSCSCSCSCHA